MEYLQKLNDTAALSAQEFSAVKTDEELEAVRVKYLGRSGVLKDLQKEFGSLPPEQKKTLGATFNNIKIAIETNWKDAVTRVEASKKVEEIDPPMDLTAPSMGRVKLSNGATIESPNAELLMSYIKADYVKNLKKMKELFQNKCNELAKTEDELTRLEEGLDKSIMIIYHLKDELATKKEQALEEYRKNHPPKIATRRRDRYFKKFPSFFE